MTRPTPEVGLPDGPKTEAAEGTLYVQRGPEPTDRDRLVGLIDDAVLAAALVDAFNECSDERRNTTSWDGVCDAC